MTLNSYLLNEELLKQEIEKEAISFSYSFCNNTEIDNVNILNASILAMHKALSMLTIEPNIIIVDGNRFKNIKTYLI
jgi:ribonuclease HII